MFVGSSSSSAGSAFLILIYLAVLVLELAGGWQVFVKAGHPGWACIIPFYNVWILLKIVGRPPWWLALFIVGLVIPFLGTILVLVLAIIVLVDLAKSFGKGIGFAVGLFFLGFIFLPILGFGSAQYRGPAAASPAVY